MGPSQVDTSYHTIIGNCWFTVLELVAQERLFLRTQWTNPAHKPHIVRRRSTICTSERVEADRRAEFLRHELESRSGGQKSTQNVCRSAGNLAMTPPVDIRLPKPREQQYAGAKFPSPLREISETMGVELHGMLFHLPESSTT
ncbi:hypothetical protein PAAG_11884 [Paracoccidioides lutzii Pb01]|uniref:Uncharacterized protein n=1 Tax=Paracoccidioides lutzii (strain ATCC MYA-826 / Pb01) TaxID=502779 RepID=A0A0A2V5J5_PARBA|nr:hypothetical protein PAAG_11884 [Paracoccidioides lutzii Pb01]KGQ01420.1 hypothetical protein PAAG_11884 [Paracoccidioides lutzii Pb01]